MDSQARILCFFRIQPETSWNLIETKQNPNRIQTESQKFPVSPDMESQGFWTLSERNCIHFSEYNSESESQTYDPRSFLDFVVSILLKV